MNLVLRKLSNIDLLQETKNLAKAETKIIAKMIDHLMEIDRRKLFCDLFYPSLYEYCRQELGLSDDQCYRRIRAMRMCQEIPATKEKLDKGELSLTNINLIDGLFKDLASASFEIKLDKSAIIDSVCGKSKNECEQTIRNIKNENNIKTRPKKSRVIKESADSFRLNISISKETLKKFEKIKGIFAHKKIDESEIMGKIMDAYLSEHEEQMKPKRAPKKAPTKAPKIKSNNENEVSHEVKTNEEPSSKRKSHSKNTTRFIKKEVKDKVYKRAGGKCENCGSVHALQFDHRYAFALGGDSEIENIRLLCRQCNLRSAVKVFGVDFMEKFCSKEIHTHLN